MTKGRGDLVAGLDAITTSSKGGTVPKVIQLFGDQPDVLDAIVRARRDRHLSYSAIADYFTKQGHRIGESSIKTYLRNQGID